MPKNARDSPVSASVYNNFQVPKRNIAAGWTLASPASMPKAAIHKYGDLGVDEHKIRLPRQFTIVHSPSRDRAANQVCAQALFCRSAVARLHQRHDP